MGVRASELAEGVTTGTVGATYAREALKSASAPMSGPEQS